MSEQRSFKTVLGNSPALKPIKTGEISPKGFALDLVEYEVTHDAFKPMVNGQAFDICEMAIVTLILAKAYGRPLHMLPAVQIGRLQQPFASVNLDVEMAGPADIAGKRIGVRSYAQTTVTWLRGILKCDYGADLDSAHWTSFEAGHVPEAEDPTERAPEGIKMVEALKLGKIDIALGLKSDGSETKPLIPNPEEAAKEWYAKYECVPVNHIIAVTDDMVASHLDDVAEVYALMREAKARAPHEGNGPDPKPMGFAAIRPSIDLLIRYMNDLGLLPRPMKTEDLIDPRIKEATGE